MQREENPPSESQTTFLEAGLYRNNWVGRVIGDAYRMQHKDSTSTAPEGHSVDGLGPAQAGSWPYLPLL
jgi:hypothetical protein